MTRTQRNVKKIDDETPQPARGFSPAGVDMLPLLPLAAPQSAMLPLRPRRLASSAGPGRADFPRPLLLLPWFLPRPGVLHRHRLVGGQFYHLGSVSSSLPGRSHPGLLANTLGSSPVGDLAHFQRPQQPSLAWAVVPRSHHPTDGHPPVIEPGAGDFHQRTTVTPVPAVPLTRIPPPE